MVAPNIAIPASLIGEPTRAAILTALCDGRSRSAGELADAAGISAQSASNHLTLLRGGGLITVVQQGRHRYFRLASPAVAQSIEALAAIAPPLRLERLGRRRGHEALQQARKCYSHLAGRLGVQLHDALLSRGYIAPVQTTDAGRTVYRLTEAGRTGLRGLGVDEEVSGLSCLDWTERRDHLAGPLGTALLRHLQAQQAFEPGTEPRSLRLTARGEAVLRALGVDASERERKSA